MRDEPFLPRRRSVRLRSLDYSETGAYFLTICVQDKRPLFGRVIGSEVALSPLGRIANECWLAIPHHFAGVELGPRVIMPDHVHGIVILHSSPMKGNRAQTEANIAASGDHLAKNVRRTRYTVPLRPEPGAREFAAPIARSIPTIVGVFKAAVSREAVRQTGRTVTPIWQRGYYEHVIWDEKDFRNACQYIQTNPARRSFERGLP